MIRIAGAACSGWPGRSGGCQLFLAPRRNSAARPATSSSTGRAWSRSTLRRPRASSRRPRTSSASATWSPTRTPSSSRTVLPTASTSSGRRPAPARRRQQRVPRPVARATVEVVGREWHLPVGGALEWVRQPVPAAAIAGSVRAPARGRPEPSAVRGARAAPRPRPRIAPSRAAKGRRALEATAVLGGMVVLGLLLGLVAWTRPTTERVAFPDRWRTAAAPCEDAGAGERRVPDGRVDTGETVFARQVPKLQVRLEYALRLGRDDAPRGHRVARGGTPDRRQRLAAHADARDGARPLRARRALEGELDLRAIPDHGRARGRSTGTRDRVRRHPRGRSRRRRRRRGRRRPAPLRPDSRVPASTTAASSRPRPTRRVLHGPPGRTAEPGEEHARGADACRSARRSSRSATCAPRWPSACSPSSASPSACCTCCGPGWPTTAPTRSSRGWSTSPGSRRREVRDVPSTEALLRLAERYDTVVLRVERPGGRLLGVEVGGSSTGTSSARSRTGRTSPVIERHVPDGARGPVKRARIASRGRAARRPRPRAGLRRRTRCHASRADARTQSITANTVKPSACAALTLTAVVSVNGSGNPAELVLGTARRTCAGIRATTA